MKFNLKRILKKLGKCIGLGVLTTVVNHASGDNHGSLTQDIKVAILAGVAAAVKTEGKKGE